MALIVTNAKRGDMTEIDKINELPEPDEHPPANENSAESKPGFRQAKRASRAMGKRWIGIVAGQTPRNKPLNCLLINDISMRLWAITEVMRSKP